MKKLAFFSALAISTSLFAASASAENFAVTGTGSVTDTTCSAEIDKTTLTMGVVNKAAFTNVGAVSVGDEFTVSVKNCPTLMTKAKIKIAGTPDNVNANLFSIKNLAGSAIGIGVQVKAKNGTVIAPNATTDYTLSNGIATVPYEVDYVSTIAQDDIRAGNADVAFNVVVDYE